MSDSFLSSELSMRLHSDPALEESLRVRLDFIFFTGFDSVTSIPDETTLCRFRNKLISQGLLEKLFLIINSQLENLGLKLKEANGAIIDASLKNGIMFKAYRNRPLTHWQKKFNRAVSKKRYRVEQTFATLKRRFSFTRARYFGLPKVKTEKLHLCRGLDI